MGSDSRAYGEYPSTLGRRLIGLVGPTEMTRITHGSQQDQSLLADESNVIHIKAFVVIKNRYSGQVKSLSWHSPR